MHNFAILQVIVMRLLVLYVKMAIRLVIVLQHLQQICVIVQQITIIAHLLVDVVTF